MIKGIPGREKGGTSGPASYRKVLSTMISSPGSGKPNVPWDLEGPGSSPIGL